MKVLILSLSTGRGHMSAANTIKDYLISKNVSAEVVDTLEDIHPIMNKTIIEGYEYLAKKAPGVFKIMYNSSNNNRVFTNLIFGITSMMSRKLLPLIEEYKPDIIITTHPFSTEMASKLKQNGKINVPIVCVMTDYAPHRTWINPEVNAYIVADEDMILSMIDMGVREEIIYPFGIPINESFYIKRDKSKILKKLGMNPNISTVLMMAGGFGFGNLIEVFKEIQKIDLEFQIIIITGKNKKLFDAIEDLVYSREPQKNMAVAKFEEYTEKLKKPVKMILKKEKNEESAEKIPAKKTHVIYFTSEVNKYMWISDLIITKPGGLTISEALACNLPLVIFDAIPGQEEENAEFLISNNMAVKFEPGERGAETIKNLIGNASKLESMKQQCENFDKSDSLENIYNILKKLMEAKD